MIKSNLPLAVSSWDDKEIDAIQKVIDSQQFSMGEKVKEFEASFSRYLNCKHAVMVNSGSSANLLMIASLFYTKKPFLKPGDEVIVPAISWSTTYFPLHQYGLKIKFVDIDKHTLNLDIEKLKQAITSSTKLIMAVNLLGNPNHFDEIKSLIKNKDIQLIEDNCESLGSKYNNQFSGTFGLCGSFSTFFSHHISTMEGGIVTTNNDEIYQILISLRAHGWTRNLPKNNLITGNKSEDAFEESFKFVLPGYNLRPIELSGAIGIEQVKKLDQFIETRRKNALHFKSIMDDNPFFMIQTEIGKSSWFGFSLIVKQDSGVVRKDLIDFLSEKLIEYRPIVSGSFVKQPVIKYLNVDLTQDLSNSDYVHENGLFIGNHHFDIRSKLDLIKSFKK